MSIAAIIEFFTSKWTLYAVGALLLVAGGWYVHHHIYDEGYAAGAKDGDAKAAAALLKQRAAESAAGGWENDVKTITAAMENDKKIADDAARIAAAARVRAEAQATANAKDAATWQAKYNAASKTPACADLAKVKICEQLLDY